MAFVLTYLLPLLIIALDFNILSAEREQGILPLLLAQPVSGAQLVAARLTFRLGLVLGVAGLLSVMGFAWAGVPPDGRMGLWLALVALYCGFWQAVVLLVTAWQRGAV